MGDSLKGTVPRYFYTSLLILIIPQFSDLNIFGYGFESADLFTI